MEGKMDEMFNLFSAFVKTSKTIPPSSFSLDTEKAHVDLATEEVGAHVGPIVEKPITNMDANFESQGTSANQEKVSGYPDDVVMLCINNLSYTDIYNYTDNLQLHVLYAPCQNCNPFVS